MKCFHSTNFLKVFILSFFFYYFIFSLTAQSDQYVSGFVVLSNSDTIRGQIEYINWNKNPTTINFKDKGKVIKYTIKDLRAFVIPQKANFKRSAVKYNITPQSTELLRTDKELTWKNDTVWLEALWLGSVNLYRYYELGSGEHFFIENKSLGLEELLDYKYRQIINNEPTSEEVRGGKNTQKVNKVVRRRQYRNQLKKYLYDCKDLFKIIDRLELRISDLIQLMEKSQKCLDGDEVFFRKPKDKTGIELSLLGGGVYSNVSQSGQLIIDDEVSSFRPAFGIRLEVVSPKNRKAFSAFGEFNYLSYRTSDTYENLVVIGPSPSEPGFVTLDYLRFNLGIRRVIINKNFKLFGFGGVGNGFLIGQNDSEREYRKHEQCFFLGLNGTYKDFGLGVRYERGNGYSPFSTITTQTRSVHFLLAYRFFKNSGARE